MNSEFNAFHQAENNFFCMVSFSKIDYGDLVSYATGVQASGLNPTYVNEIEEQFSEHVTRCQAFYNQRELPWTLAIPDYLYEKSIEVLLQKHLLELAWKETAMMALIDNITTPVTHSPLSVKEMKGDLNIWSIPLIHGFESTPEVTKVYTIRHELASQSGARIHHFSGFIDDTVVCSLTLSLCNENARIDDVATIPAFQKKGYATQLMCEALNFAKKLNVKKCFLGASENGLNIYKKIGFNELFINHYYEQQSDSLS